MNLYSIVDQGRCVKYIVSATSSEKACKTITEKEGPVGGKGYEVTYIARLGVVNAAYKNVSHVLARQRAAEKNERTISDVMIELRTLMNTWAENKAPADAAIAFFVLSQLKGELTR